MHNLETTLRIITNCRRLPIWWWCRYGHDHGTHRYGISKLKANAIRRSDLYDPRWWGFKSRDGINYHLKESDYFMWALQGWPTCPWPFYHQRNFHWRPRSFWWRVGWRYCDAIIRLIPGVLGNETSALTDSFKTIFWRHLFIPDHDVQGQVPKLLFSGNFRNRTMAAAQALERTKSRRPDLLEVKKVIKTLFENSSKTY